MSKLKVFTCINEASPVAIKKMKESFGFKDNSVDEIKKKY